jgi:hypothetical protein
MEKIACRTWTTQIERVLTHAKNETAKQPVNALVFVGDAMEESGDILDVRARQLGRLGTRAFMFQEGRDPEVEAAFRDIARHSGGAYGRFDAGAAKQLCELLRAAAVFAAGGLAPLKKRKDTSSVLLIDQLKGA